MLAQFLVGSSTHTHTPALSFLLCIRAAWALGYPSSPHAPRNVSVCVHARMHLPGTVGLQGQQRRYMKVRVAPRRSGTTRPARSTWTQNTENAAGGWWVVTTPQPPLGPSQLSHLRSRHTTYSVSSHRLLHRAQDSSIGWSCKGTGWAGMMRAYSPRGHPRLPAIFSVLKTLPSPGLFPRNFTLPRNVPEVLPKYHLCPQ